MFAIFPEILHAAQKGDQETLSCLVRKYFAGSELYAPRMRVEPLLESLGVSLTREQAPYFARIQVIDHRGQYRVSISLSSRLEGTRELNYTLAHLLGYLLNQFLPLMAEADLSAEAYQLEASLLSRLSQKASAAEVSELSSADRFALALLMPLGMVKKAHQTLRTEEDCAAFFQVPRTILRLRLLQVCDVAPQTAPSQTASAPQSPQGEGAARTPVEQKKPQTAVPTPKVATSAKSKTTSIARAQQSVASRSYRQEEARLQPEQKPASATTSDTPGSGLKRLRELAKKIDKSVES